MSEFIRLQANGVDAYPDASTENTYRSNGTSVESALLALESNVTTLGGVAGEAKTLAEQNSVKIATAEQEISDINSSLEKLIKVKVITLDTTSISPNDEAVYYLSQFYAESEYTIASVDVTYNEVNFSSSLVSNFLDDKLYIKNIGSNEVKNLVPTLRILFVNN